ncbi:nucleolar protein 8 isoform 1-T1 [Rhynchonycteris naso]
MSKKRRGNFSDLHSHSKKIIKVQKDESATESLALKPRPRSEIIESPHLTQQLTAQEIPNPITPKSPHVPDSHCQKLKSGFFQTSGLETTSSKNNMSDDDNSSEDELRLMISREKNLEKITWSSENESENDSFEVVRDDFKSDTHKLYSLTCLGIKSNVSCFDSEDDVGNDCDYDLGDRDDTAMKKNFGEVKNSPEFSQMKKSIYKKTLKNRKNSELSGDCIKVQKRKNNTKLAINHRAKHLICTPQSKSMDNEDVASVSESATSQDEEYNTMMKNCLHVSLTLADLGQLAGSNLKAPKGDNENDGWETTSKNDRASKSHRTSNGLHRGRQCISPDEILASLLEEESIPGKRKPKEDNLKPKFQAFKGVGYLYGKESVEKSLKENVASSNINKNQNSLKLDPTSLAMEKGLPYTNGSSSKLTPSQCAKKADDPNLVHPQNREFTFKSQNHKVVSTSSSEKGSRNPISSLLTLKDKESVSLGAENSTRGFDEDCSHTTTKTGEGSEKRPDLTSLMVPGKSPEVSRMDTQESEPDFPLSLNSSSDVSTKDKHVEDNQKRLAALEARQKAKELQKKLVHNALANLDGHPENKSTHIIFGSDSESEIEETSTREQSHLVEKPVKEFLGRTSGKLFDSSDDEESDSGDDSKRFRIKPQFEGRAGKKLMDLQSHFGTDERFRMDSRFLESDSEEEQEEVNEKKTTEKEELATEKLKALNIVQSILHSNSSNSTSKGPVAAKKFKDIIHYDPTRHDHATYEKKNDDTPKESKAKRKKKREEAEKLPVVSKEMYYNIAMDLKEIFQTTKNANEKEDEPWNEDCDGEEAKEIHDPEALLTGTKQPGGFTFSFFDSDTKDVKQETYKVETVKPCKTAWQGAPRFQDSSSEEEDVAEETDDKKPSPGEVSLPEKETTRYFFFSKNDERLHAGSDLFWKGMGGNISRHSWEARTNNLRMDCRKKHKDAKRRVKPK